MILLTNKDGPTITQFWFFKNIILIYQYARCNDVETINRKKHHKHCPLKLLLQYWNSGIKMFLLRHTALTHHFSHKLFHVYIYDNLLASGAPRRQGAYWIVHSISKKANHFIPNWNFRVINWQKYNCNIQIWSHLWKTIFFCSCT